jgi:hypothetical protein
MKRAILMLGTLALLLGGAGQAKADLVFHLERTDDTHATLTVTGTLPDVGYTPPNAYIFTLADPFSVDPPLTSNDPVGLSGTLDLAGFPFTRAYDGGAQQNYVPQEPGPTLYLVNDPIYGASPVVPGMSFSGAAQLVLPRETFAPVGSTGNVYWGVQFGPALVGTWEIVGTPSSVPEPSSLALLGTAAATFGGYLGWRRRKEAAAAY